MLSGRWRGNASSSIRKYTLSILVWYSRLFAAVSMLSYTFRVPQNTATLRLLFRDDFFCLFSGNALFGFLTGLKPLSNHLPNDIPSTSKYISVLYLTNALLHIDSISLCESSRNTSISCTLTWFVILELSLITLEISSAILSMQSGSGWT